MNGSNRGTAVAFSEARSSKLTRLLALLLGFAMLCFGMVAGAGSAQAAGDHTVSGTIQFPASAPSEIQVPYHSDGDEGYVGIYLTLYVKQEGTVEGWRLGEDANVSFDAATGAWAVTDVPDGEYRLTINVSLPNNGYAPGSFQELTVSGGDVAVGTTSISEEGRLRAAIARCGWEIGDETAFYVKNTATGTVYTAEPAQSGWVEPSTDCPPEVSYGNYSFSGLPAGDYTAYSVWNGDTQYYTGLDAPTSSTASDALVFSVKNWEGTSLEALVFPHVVAGTPTISGTAKVGQALSANPGTWQPASATLAYQWLRDGAAISGATSATYTPVAADQGKRISVQVTGTKAGYEPASKTSAQTSAVAGADFAWSVDPTISGTAQVGKTLTASAGTVSPTPDSLVYQWLRDGSAISGATSSTYALVAADQGKRISVQVTGTKTGYEPASKTSAQTSAVAGADFAWSVDPTIDGTPAIGETLTANVGEIAPDPDSVEYTWLRDGDEIDGADGQSYTATAEDADHSLSVRVTVSKQGHADETRTTEAVEIPKGVLTSSTPTISGTAQVGEKLTAKPGTWGPGDVSLAYQWLRDGAAISGATSATYTPVAADQGKRISVQVTGTKTGYEPASKTSAQTAAVAAKPDPEPTKPPFADVSKNQKFAKEITWMYTSGLSTGVKTPTGREYQPKNGVSREAMAAFLYRMEGAKYTGPKVSPFADVKPGDKFYNEITWMYAKGLSTGVKQSSGKPNYQPKVTVTREAMAAFIYRLEETKYTAPSTSFFSDVSRGDKFYREISWMYDSGLSTGVKQPSGKPAYQSKAQVTREAMAAFLYRLEN